MFATTWLSYVGFYFCRAPFSKAKGAIGTATGWDAATLGNIWAAYLVTYALGQFLASRMGPKLGPRRNVLLGMALSVTVTLAMGVTLTWQVMTGLVAINGLAQATGWSGNVGTMASWFHKHERGRVMGVWSTNFTVGALTSGWVMALVLDLASWQFGPDALLTGAGAMDIGSRRLATFAAATISGFGSLGAVVQELLISRMYNPKQDGLGPIFAMLFGSAALAAMFCGALVWRNRRGGKGI